MKKVAAILDQVEPHNFPLHWGMHHGTINEKHFFTNGFNFFLDLPSPPCYEIIYQKKLTYTDVGRKATGLEDGKQDSRVAWDGAVRLFNLFGDNSLQIRLQL